MSTLSIIVVTFNSLEYVDACLESVVPLTRGVELEVLVVDNDSSDGSASAVEERFPWVRVVRNVENLGFARAVNAGIGASSGDLILLLNPDARLLDGAVERLVTFLDAHPDVGVAGAQLLEADFTVQPSVFRLNGRLGELQSLLPARLVPEQTRTIFDPHVSDVGVQDVEAVSGACLMARRSVFEAVGALDGRFFFCFEDFEFCRRVRTAGWRVVYYPDAQAVHFHGRSSERAHGRLRLQNLDGYFLFLRLVYGRPFELLVRALWATKSSLVLPWIAAHLRSPWERRKLALRTALLTLLVSAGVIESSSVKGQLVQMGKPLL